MEESSLALVNQSFVRLIPYSDVAVKIFVERLSVIDPLLGRRLGPGFLQNVSLVPRTLALLVEALRTPERMVRLSRRVGSRYAALGVTPDHYPAIGEAFSWTLRQLMPDGIGDESLNAWSEAFAVLAHHMKEGASVDAGQAAVAQHDSPAQTLID